MIPSGRPVVAMSDTRPGARPECAGAMTMVDGCGRCGAPTENAYALCPHRIGDGALA